MSKLNSYQKLKLENEKLHNDIYNLVVNGDKSIGIETNFRYKIKFDIINQVFFGVSNNNTTEFSGLIPQIVFDADPIDKFILDEYIQTALTDNTTVEIKHNKNKDKLIFHKIDKNKKQ